LDVSTVPITGDDTTESLTPKLADAAATLLDSRLADLLAGAIHAKPQPEGATETRQLTKNDGRIDWNEPASEIERQVRAMWSWPRAWTLLDDDTRVQIHAAKVANGNDLEPGAIGIHEKSIVVGTGEGGLELLRVQLPGGKPVDENALFQKLQPLTGSRFV